MKNTVLKLTILEIPPSNNKFMGRGSKNYQAFAYQEEKKRWAWLVRQALGRTYIKLPKKNAVVKIKYYFKDRRRRDPDNYSGKFILDGLVHAGVLADDSFNNIELILRGGYDRKNPRTEIEIEEVR